MKRINLNKCAIIFSTLALTTFGYLPRASASDSLNLDGINSNYLQQETITFNGNTSTDYAGAIVGTLGGGANQFFFCYDLAHTIDVPGSYQVNPTSPSSTFPSYLGLSQPFNLEVASALLNTTNLASLTNVNQFTGLQLAIWSILYNWTSGQGGQSTNLSGPIFSVSSPSQDVLNAAQGYLSNAVTLVNNGTYTNTGAWAVLVNANDSPGNVTQTLTGVSAPEPQTYLTLGSFLLFAAYCYKRRLNERAA